MPPDLPRYLDLYVSESRRHLARALSIAGAPEAGDVGADELRELYRVAHSMKGMAAAMGLDEVARLAHAAEDRLQRALDAPRRLDARSLLPLLSRLSQMVEETAELGRLDPLPPPSTSTLARLVPFLSAVAHRAAAAAGKKVRLDVVGAEVEMERALVDGMAEPLVHVVRNAVDHGIEPPLERAALGKPATGRLLLRLDAAGGGTRISLADDGRGMDPEALRGAAVLRGLLSGDEAAAIDDDGALRLISLAGFTTASAPGALSGRGVGMDAVKARIEELGGRVEVESIPGQGTHVALVLPRGIG